MKNEFFNSVVTFLNSLGIIWKYLVNGFIGATVWAIYKKEKFLAAIRQIIIGSFVAGYFTPIVVDKASVSIDYVGSISFIIGMLGMVLIDSAYRYVIRNYEKWKEILKILFSK